MKRKITLKRRFTKVLSVFLSLLMLTSTMGTITILADDRGSEWQIEKRDDSVVYHALNTSGVSIGSDTTDVKTSAGGKVSISKTISPTTMENVFDITLRVDTKQETRNEIVSPDAAVVLVLDASTSMDWCASCGKEENHADHKTSKFIKNACPDSSGNSYKKTSWDNSTCINCGKAESLHNNKTITNPPVCTWTGTRLDAAKAASISFSKQFASDANGAKRYISVVKFNRDGDRVYNWFDAASLNWEGETPSNALTAAINGITTFSGTNIEAGLQLADNLLRTSPVSSIANRYAVLLTDGSPNSRITDSADRTGTDHIDGNWGLDKVDPEKVAANCAADVAKKITNPTTSDGLEVPLYSVCYGASGDVIIGLDKNVGTWLAEISTRSFSASNASELTISLGNILNQINLITKAWTVSDPMGPYIAFDTAYNTANNGIAADSAANLRNYNTNTRTLKWNLNGETHTSIGSGDSKTDIYTLTYRVRLDTSAQGFEENTYYLTNGYTELAYAFYDGNNQLLDEAGQPIYNPDGTVNQSSDKVTTLRTLGFKVPAVKGELPVMSYTVNYHAKGRDGNYMQEKTESGTAKLWSSVDLRSDAFTKTNYHYVSGDEGTQQINAADRVFNLYYDPDMTSVTVNHYYKTITIAEDGSSDESTAAYGQPITVPVNNLYVSDSYTATPNTQTDAYSLVAEESDELTISSLKKTDNVINLYYVRTIDNRLGADVKVLHIYTHNYYELEDGTYVPKKDVTTVTGYDSTQVSGSNHKVTELYEATKIPNGYNFIGATATAGIVSGTETRTRLQAGANVITLNYEKTTDPRGNPITVTVNHHYTKTVTTVTGGIVSTVVNPEDATKAVSFDKYVGESFTASEDNSYNGEAYHSDPGNAAKLVTTDPLTGSVTIDLYYTLVESPANTTVTVNHYYRTFETYTADEETGAQDVRMIDDGTVIENFPSGNDVLYVGQRFTASPVNRDGYSLNSAASGSISISSLAGGGNVINLYYDRTTDVRDDASIQVTHKYYTNLTTIVGGSVATIKVQDGDMVVENHSGKAGDSFTAVPATTNGGMDYTLVGSPSLTTTLHSGSNSSIDLVYERSDSSLVPTDIAVNYIYNTYTMTVADGIANYYDAPVVETAGGMVEGTYYKGQIFNVTPQPIHNGVEYAPALNNPALSITLGESGANIMTLTYNRYMPLAQEYVSVNHHYALTTWSIADGESRSNVQNTSSSDSPVAKYVGETFTATLKENGYTFKKATSSNETLNGSTITVSGSDDVIDLYYEKTEDPRIASSVTVNHYYTDVDYNGDRIERTDLNDTRIVPGYAGLLYTAVPDTKGYSLVRKEAAPEFAAGYETPTILMAEGPNTISFYYELSVDSREAASITVIHHYSLFDRYTGINTNEGTTTNVFNSFSQGVWVGAEFNTALAATYNSRAYVLDETKSDSRTLTLAADRENVINLYYQRTVDSTPSIPPVDPGPGTPPVDPGPGTARYTIVIRYLELNTEKVLAADSVTIWNASSSYDVTAEANLSIAGYVLASRTGDAVTGVVNSTKAITVWYTEETIVPDESVPEGTAPTDTTDDKDTPAGEVPAGTVDINDEDVPQGSVPADSVDAKDEAVPKGNAPQTGDSSMLSILVAMMVLSSIGLTVLLIMDNKDKKRIRGN